VTFALMSLVYGTIALTQVGAGGLAMVAVFPIGAAIVLGAAPSVDRPPPGDIGDGHPPSSRGVPEQPPRPLGVLVAAFAVAVLTVTTALGWTPSLALGRWVDPGWRVFSLGTPQWHVAVALLVAATLGVAIARDVLSSHRAGR